MPRPSWKGFIRLSLVSVPVEAYTAEAGQEQISFNQLHEDCHERIRYVKTCPIHGEVDNHEIVKGYKFGPDQYAIIDPSEIEKLRSEADRSITIDAFIKPADIDPIYFSGKTYYLTPNGAAGKKPYSLLHRALDDLHVYGLAQVVISNREQLVALRPLGDLLTISVLHYAASLKPRDEFEGLVDDEDVSPAELKLAKTLITATDRAGAKELTAYRDLYNDRLRELVDAKVEGREVATVAEAKLPPTINLIDALKASLGQAKPKAGRRPAAKKPATGRRRKTG